MNKQAYLRMMSYGMRKNASLRERELLYKIAMMAKQQGFTDDVKEWWQKDDNSMRRAWEAILKWFRNLFGGRINTPNQTATPSSVTPSVGTSDIYGQYGESLTDEDIDQLGQIKQHNSQFDELNALDPNQSPGQRRRLANRISLETGIPVEQILQNPSKFMKEYNPEDRAHQNMITELADLFESGGRGEVNRKLEELDSQGGWDLERIKAGIQKLYNPNSDQTEY